MDEPPTPYVWDEDPTIGVFEYRLRNITRSEPSSSLFDLPTDYPGVIAGGEVDVSMDFWRSR